MTDALYIATIDRYSGKSLVSLGVTELLLRKTNRVGIFRPVIGTQTDGERDKNIDLLLRHFDLHQDYEDTYGMPMREAEELIGQERYDQVLDRIIARYKALEECCDFILCIGSDLVSATAALEFDFNADVAKNLGAPVLLVGSGVDRDVAGIVSTAHTTVNAYQARGAQVLGMVVNRVAMDHLEELRGALKGELKDEDVIVAAIPAHEVLASPTMKEVAEQLSGEILFGGEHLDTLAHDYLVIAMRLDNYLGRLTENALLITPGDRSDVILSALQAHQSNRYPKVAGIVLSGGIKPAPAISRLLEGLAIPVPILSVPTDTFGTATRASSLRSYITADNRPKIDLSLELFEEFVDTAELEARISSIEPRGMTPRMFLYYIVQRAKAKKQHIVMPEGNDERILRAADALLNRDIVDLTLLGQPREVRDMIHELGLDIDLERVPIIWPDESEQFDEYAETLLELRRHKGMNLDAARDLMRDVSYYGTMMVYKGAADGMVSGAAHTTQHTILPALQFIKAKPGFTVVSSVFFMCLDDEVLVYGDCAVNPNPTAEQLAEIALSSADTAQTFGIEPRVAMLSYSSGESGVGEDVERVRTATQIARERRPDLQIVGPIQYDAAVDASVAAKKMPGSDVAGRATVFVFPDLNTGNNTYKAVQRETGAIAIGPVLQGLKKPINDLSRGATVEDVINTVAITAIQAQNV
ncbi:MAG: phosphate acetyltransferase [Anaerolineaceae bacterium]|nr:phosphate acetyltransferase [Anaerolineaceae bacterium]